MPEQSVPTRKPRGPNIGLGTVDLPVMLGAASAQALC